MMRSNYFAVKDGRKFLGLCRRCDFEPIKNDKNLRGFYSEEPLGFQESIDLGADSQIDYAFMDELADLLVDGHVAIIMEIDHDKMRYLDGTAWAINSRHESRKVDLTDIYELAEQLGQYVTKVLY